MFNDNVDENQITTVMNCYKLLQTLVTIGEWVQRPKDLYMWRRVLFLKDLWRRDFLKLPKVLHPKDGYHTSWGQGRSITIQQFAQHSFYKEEKFELTELSQLSWLSLRRHFQPESSLNCGRLLFLDLSESQGQDLWKPLSTPKYAIARLPHQHLGLGLINTRRKQLMK